MAWKNVQLWSVALYLPIQICERGAPVAAKLWRVIAWAGHMFWGGERRAGGGGDQPLVAGQSFSSRPPTLGKSMGGGGGNRWAAHVPSPPLQALYYFPVSICNSLLPIPLSYSLFAAAPCVAAVAHSCCRTSPAERGYLAQKEVIMIRLKLG